MQLLTDYDRAARKQNNNKGSAVLKERRASFNFLQSKALMSDKACHNMDSLPVTNKTAGEPESLMNKTLETGAATVQVRRNFGCSSHLSAKHA